MLKYACVLEVVIHVNMFVLLRERQQLELLDDAPPRSSVEIHPSG
jgi:hypothetical protein